MHLHRSSALGYASAASAAHSRVYGACAAEAAASESSGLSVGGCIRAWRYFGPHPVKYIYCSPPCACHALTVFSSRHKSRLELAILAFKLYKNNYTVDGPLGSLRLTVTARKRGH